jgi:cytidylate kinase
MTVIALTREIGTRGQDVAVGLAERLGLKIVQHDLVEHDIAERAGLPDSAVHRYFEGEATLLERWRLDRRRLSQLTAEEVLEFAAAGKVLIRGWGASYLLRGIPHVLRVRLYAPMEVRERNLMERARITNAAVARRELEHDDAAHDARLRELFGIDWRDPTLYTIMLNTGWLGVADCVETIARLAESPAFEETPLSQRALADRLCELRVRSALDKRFGTQSPDSGFDVVVSEGRVVLTGATSDSTLVVDAVRLVQCVPGVAGVESRIRYVDFHAPGW